MSNLCVIFDLDGTLVDSEGLCNQAFLDLLPDLEETIERLTHRYRGLKLAVILEELEGRLRRPLPRDFESRYRERVAALFATQLKAMPGTDAMLGALQVPRCVASSGPRPKIVHALQVTGLTRHFGEKIYSSYDIGSWKPDPGLFLNAASSMGYAPDQCVVIEDSEVGLRAAEAAGMRALHYSPGTPSGRAEEDGVFSHMQDLPPLIARFRQDRR
jgi:HAD superfamily hydrolase (TIGR01509 family)